MLRAYSYTVEYETGAGPTLKLCGENPQVRFYLVNCTVFIAVE
jgi:hypothetical protein